MLGKPKSLAPILIIYLFIYSFNYLLNSQLHRSSSEFLQVMISSSKKLKAYVHMILGYPKPPLLLIRVIFL